ncbi:hydrolase [Oceanobacillus sp. FSL K6-2867]|uniref:hydrolase n=1 Tax=Oceanobacillus sp. FSL K6-2867 TaxID=2954748 RepID=UPI0030D93087
MTNKNHYFIAVKEREIREIPVDDNEEEFEIIADDDELSIVRELFLNMKDHANEATSFIIKDPFNDRRADLERNEYEKNLQQVYRKIYELGTEETKAKIQETGIIE